MIILFFDTKGKEVKTMNMNVAYEELEVAELLGDGWWIAGFFVGAAAGTVIGIIVLT